MRPIAISFSPNVQADDVRIARKLLLRPDVWHDEEAVRAVGATLSRILDKQLVVPTSSGRAALTSILKAYGIKRSDEVILQAFTCIAVPGSVLWRHATPVYADVLPNTYTLDPADVRRKITAHTKAIIIQHTFGIPAPLKELQAIAQEYNILLIEDCAHALGSTYEHKPLGTFGDAAIMSFGRDKMFSSVFGGAVVSSNQQLIAAVLDEQKELTDAPTSWVMQQLFHPLLFATALPLYNIIGIGKGMLALARTLKVLSRAVAPIERKGGRPAHLSYKYSPALAYLLMNQLEKYKDYTQQRESLGQRYFSGLQKFSAGFPTILDDSKVAWLRFPLLIQNRQEFLQAAKKSGMILGDWYNGALAPADVSFEAFGYMKGTCKVAEASAAHVVNLPTYPVLSDAQVDRVIDFTNKHAVPYHP